MTITLQDLEVWTRLGVPDAERAAPQRVLVTVSFDVPVPAEDELGSTVNYAAVADAIRSFAAERERKLVETFVRDLAARLAGSFGVGPVRVELKKFILPETRWISVRHTGPGPA